MSTVGPIDFAVFAQGGSNYIQRIDYDANSNAIYLGWAQAGTATSDAKWRIVQNTYDASNRFTASGFALGSPAFCFGMGFEGDLQLPMKNFLIVLGLAFVCVSASAEPTKTVFNPFTGKLDFITSLAAVVQASTCTATGVGGIQLSDSAGCLWCETLSTAGAWVATLIRSCAAAFVLMEDGTFVLMEDGTKITVEQ